MLSFNTALQIYSDLMVNKYDYDDDDDGGGAKQWEAWPSPKVDLESWSLFYQAFVNKKDIMIGDIRILGLATGTGVDFTGDFLGEFAPL